MSSADPLAVLEVAERNELESLLMEFDGTWKPNSLDEYGRRITAHPDQMYRHLALAELVKIDLQRTWSAGNGRRIEDYLVQFPLLGSAESVNSDLIVAEYEARKGVESELDLAGYESRFPKQFQRIKKLASRPLDSNAASSSRKRRTEKELVQASIDTSRVDQLHDTQSGSKRDVIDDLPVEFGRYRILKQLGAGAMGKVYLAHDSQLDRQIALKTPSFRGVDNDDMVTRFYREARAAAKLHHRNICPIYDVGEIDGRHFISMAFVKGRSMSELIKPNKLPPQRTSAILVQRLAAALAEAHKHHVIHRDLKPANIMIDLKKEPIVMDFGLARQTDSESRVTQSGMAVGTPAYMSPEQVRGDVGDVGAGADIYALGVILYELLTGRLPFRGPIAKVVYGIVHEEPTAPSTIRQGIDSELESICTKMMAKDKADRFQSMEDVALALKTYVRGDSQPNHVKTSSTTKSVAPSSKSSDEALTETGALNAFFAAQAEANTSGTKIESALQSIVAEKPKPAKKSTPPKTSSRSGRNRRGRRKLLVASGFAGGISVLLGVVIYFNGGRVELDDDSDAVVEVTGDGKLLISSSQSKATSPVRKEDPDSGNWQALIDPTLSQWVRFPSGSPVAGDWVANHDVLRVAKASSGDIRTKNSYEDFELQFEWKIGTNGNSGLIYRVAPGSQVSWQAGPEYQLMDEFNYTGSLKPEQRTGAIYGLFPPTNSIAKPIGEWNQSRIIANGPQIEHWLNGSKVAEAEVGSEGWEAALRRYGRLDDYPHFATAQAGYIVLQSHRSEVAYRNIRLREIERARHPVQQPNGLSRSSTAGSGFVDLFNGQDLKGWRGVEGLWKWQGNELVGATRINGKPFSHNTALCSDRRYQDFDLMFDVKLESANAGTNGQRPPNSGIQFRSRIVDLDSYKVFGPQADIGDQTWGSVYGEGTTGWMHRVDANLVESIVRDNEWNHYHLTVEGDRISIKINGTSTVDRRFPGMASDGIIGFQLHGRRLMTARFRNVRIREMNRRSNEQDSPSTVRIPAPANPGTLPDLSGIDPKVKLLNEWQHGARNSSNWYLARLSPDGRRVAFRLQQGPLTISECDSKQNLKIPAEMQDAISLAFSSDGRLIATGHENKKVRLWDADSFAPVGEPFESPVEQRVPWVHLSADGTKLIAMGNDHGKVKHTSTFHTWEISTRKLISRFQAGMDDQRLSDSIDASEDGRLVAVISLRGGPTLWDTTTGKQVPVQFEFDERLAGMMRITGMDLSADGSRLAYGTLWGAPSYVAILDTSTGKELWRSNKQKGRVHCVQFTNDGKWLASTAGRTKAHQLSLWDVNKGAEIERWTYQHDSDSEHADRVKFLSFSKDGSRLMLTGGYMPVVAWSLFGKRDLGPPGSKND